MADGLTATPEQIERLVDPALLVSYRPKTSVRRQELNRISPKDGL